MQKQETLDRIDAVSRGISELLGDFGDTDVKALNVELQAALDKAETESMAMLNTLRRAASCMKGGE